MRVLLIAFVTLLQWVEAAEHKSVIASLYAKWSSTSLLAETSEFIGHENNASYWKFANSIAEAITTDAWPSLTSEKKYELSLKHAAPLLSTSGLDLLKLSLSIRAFSPAVQLFQQIGEEYHSVKCNAFFDVHGVTGCTSAELEAAVEKADKSQSVEILSVDHVLSFAAGPSPLTIIVFGDLGSPEWTALHGTAKTLARQNKANYVHRHFTRNTDESKVGLSGYGVELAIKNTEYKAEDDSNKKDDVPAEDEEDLHGFNIKKLKELHPSEVKNIEAFRIHLKEIEELAPLKQWQVQNLTYQAAQKIMNVDSQEAIATLKDLSQNFPLHARLIAAESVSSGLRKEVEENQAGGIAEANLEPGEAALFVNGINLDVDSLDMFQLIETLKQEEKLSSGFYNMGYKREYLAALSEMELSDEKASYAVDYREAKPMYVNNLDVDKKYTNWANSIKLMLQPYYPGMIRPIARNIFTLVFVVDPTDPDSRHFFKLANAFYKHEIPIRLGFVFVVTEDEEATGKTDAGLALLDYFNYVIADSDAPTALAKINQLMNQLDKEEFVKVHDVITFFEANHDGETEEVFGKDSEYAQTRANGVEFLRKTGIGEAPKVLLNGYVLEDKGIKVEKFEETVTMEVMKVTPKIQRAVMAGKLNDKGNIQNQLLDQPDVMPRLNKRILDAPSLKKFLDLTDVAACSAKTPSEFVRLSEAKRATCIAERMRYAQRGEEDAATRAVTLWVAADLESEGGRQLLYSTLKHVKFSNKARVGLLLNPSNEEAACKPDSVSFLTHAAFRTLPAAQAKLFIAKLIKEENVEGLRSGSVKIADLAINGMDVEGFLKEKKLLNCDRIKSEKSFVTEVVGIPVGKTAIVANGMVIGPLEEGEAFADEDVGLLEKLLVARGAQILADRVDKKWKVQTRHGKSSDVVMRAYALIGKHAVARKRTWVVLSGGKHSVVTLPAEDENRATTDIVAIVDPLSRQAQKLAPILELLRSATNCDMKIVFNPKGQLSELPLKRFYRYVASSELQFDHHGGISSPQALFTNLPSKQLLTLSVTPPDAWMVEAVFAKYDLDNIKMEQVDGDVIARFSLEHILLEGHCFDDMTGQPPRGLQYILGTPSQPAMYDTIVMANLGYFQLKATPGAWLLRLREGRSKDIYKVVEHANTEGENKEGEYVRVLIDSFSGRTIRIRVTKREGKEAENLLNEGGNQDEGIWSSVASALGANQAPQEKHETINVFSLASGHLYERFMRIMILSTVKKTKAPVKFWLLKNYLSPQFKETLPLMAAEYGFEYALVEYKWPRWLNQQKEKQRIMWGYKILFLDVLFPLDVHKIIFVDADQVVRADLLELMNFDLGGAPYGYVPFCESRREMDGFRFWKQGYWANHLAGRQYHISALYVIDLQKFRQIAAGDRLRGQYQGLSADPNSLANLDQDLPNNMIHQVRIKSLPQEWLWCETWCDDSTKGAAKTIDLCNNPLTKEPKLDSAQRIIPEWNEYDQEIKKVISKGSKTSTSKGKADEEKHEEL